MSIKDLRKELEEIRAYAREGDLAQVVHTVDRALHTLAGDQLATTTEAAQLLGIRSVNTLKLLVRRSGIRYELHGNRMMIPLAELERIQDSPEVRGIRASDRAHDAAEDLGAPQGLTPAQMEELQAARPGRLPWEPSPPPAPSRDEAAQ
jgi:hypothetical protein